MERIHRYNKRPYLELFFTPEFWEILVNGTNIYAKQYKENNKEYLERHKYAFWNQWKDTNLEEMKKFIGRK